MEIFIRNIDIKDSNEIAELSGQLGYGTDIGKIENRLAEILNNSEHCVYVATNENSILGWIHGFYSMRVESDAFVEIGGLVVGEHYRNKGIGRILVEHVIAWAQQVKCHKIRVRCNVMRKESHVFYERIGFNLNKEQKVFDKRLKIS